MAKHKNPQTQRAKILAHLKTGRPLTPMQAIIHYGALRLAARIHELKKDGYEIVTSKKRDIQGHTYAEYRLVGRQF